MARTIGVALMLATLGAAAAALAQETRNVEPVVVTATKLETPAEQLGASVSIVTEDDFKTYHYTTVDEALRQVPGVEIRRSGSLGKTTDISIRGANANQVQVLVDGVRVKNPSLGIAELSDLAPDLIDRIEIIRGPQSTLYGADAIGGVVNIITKKGRGPFSATVEQEVGNYDTLHSRGTVSGAWRFFDYAVSASHLESNGHFQNDGLSQNAASLRLGLALPANSSVTFTLRWNETNTDLPIKFLSSPLPIDPIIDHNNGQKSDTLVLGLSARSHPVTWWETEGRVGLYRNNVIFIDLPDFGFDCLFPPCEFPGRFSVSRKEAEWLNHFHVGSWSTSTFGVELRHEETENQGAFPFAGETDTRAGFFQQTLRFFQRLFMSAGVRVEDNSVFGRTTTERGSLAYLIKASGTRLRGGAGSGFRAPTFDDLFFPGFSDRTLKPEHSFSWDVGVDQRLFKDRVRLGATYFHNDFTDLISFVFTTTAPFVQGVNIGRARSQGVEFVSEVDLTDTLTLSLNYTYTDTENLETHRPLPREPFHRWNGTLTWRPTPRWTLFGQVNAVSRQFEPTGTATDPAAGVFNSGHTRIDVGGTYRLINRYAFLQSLDLTARVQNLLNEGYAEVRGFPALGIQGLVGLRASF
jgi:vitamin B12 transporter